VALGAAQDLADAPDDASLVVLSGGTDGIDGPTDAAGAWATPETVHRGREVGLDAQDHLDRNDSYAFFNALDQLLRPGPTHTNVMDVIVGVR
jgi:hydroxypyruvate reductase